MGKQWKILGREEVLGSHWYRVFKEKVQLPSGRILDDYYVRDFVKAVLIVPCTTEGNYILTKQYKHGARTEVLEFPAGHIDEGEDILTAAKRELREEVGAVADKMTIGPTFYENPTSSRGEIYVVFAEDVKQNYEQTLDDNEDIEIVKLTTQELLNALDDGRLQVPASAAAGYMAIRSNT